MASKNDANKPKQSLPTKEEEQRLAPKEAEIDIVAPFFVCVFVICLVSTWFALQSIGKSREDYANAVYWIFVEVGEVIHFVLGGIAHFVMNIDIIVLTGYIFIAVVGSTFILRCCSVVPAEY